MKRIISAFLAVAALPAFAEVNPLAIPAGAKVYIHSMGGLGPYLAAGFANKRVPLIVVADLGKADFEITGESESHQAGWARTIFLKQTGSNEQASINVINRRTSAIAFAYAVNKANSWYGKQSAAESCAKYLAKRIVKDGYAINQPDFQSWGPPPAAPAIEEEKAERSRTAGTFSNPTVTLPTRIEPVTPEPVAAKSVPTPKPERQTQPGEFRPKIVGLE